MTIGGESSPPLRLERIELLHLGFLGVAVGIAALTPGLHPASLALGGGVMAANVWLMKGVVRRVARPGRTAVAVMMLIAKSALFLGLLGLLFWHVSLDGFSFAVGITLFPAAAAIEAVRVGVPPHSEE